MKVLSIAKICNKSWYTQYLDIRINLQSSEEKIYASIEVDYGDDYVLVQETEDHFGYIPQTFAAGGTVAFPPIDENEIWTIGFVQAVVYQPGRPHVVQMYRDPDSGKNKMWVL